MDSHLWVPRADCLGAQGARAAALDTSFGFASPSAKGPAWRRSVGSPAAPAGDPSAQLYRAGSPRKGQRQLTLGDWPALGSPSAARSLPSGSSTSRLDLGSWPVERFSDRPAQAARVAALPAADGRTAQAARLDSSKSAFKYFDQAPEDDSWTLSPRPSWPAPAAVGELPQSTTSRPNCAVAASSLAQGAVLARAATPLDNFEASASSLATGSLQAATLMHNFEASASSLVLGVAPGQATASLRDYEASVGSLVPSAGSVRAATSMHSSEATDFDDFFREKCSSASRSAGTASSSFTQHGMRSRGAVSGASPSRAAWPFEIHSPSSGVHPVAVLAFQSSPMRVDSVLSPARQPQPRRPAPARRALSELLAQQDNRDLHVGSSQPERVNRRKNPAPWSESAANPEARAARWNQVKDLPCGPSLMDKRRRRDEGGSLTLDEVTRNPELDRWVHRLMQVLPEEYLAKTAGFQDVASMARESESEVHLRLMHLAKGKKFKWSPDRVREASFTLGALYAYLDLNEVEHDFVHIAAADINDFLGDFVREQNRKRADRRAKFDQAAGTSGHSVGAPAERDQGKKPQTGWSSGLNRKRALAWLANGRNGIGLPFAMELVPDPQAEAAVLRQRPAASPAFTLPMIVLLELFCINPSTPPVMAHVAAGILFCTFCCMRTEQAQNQWISGLVQLDVVEDGLNDRFIRGFCRREKNPDPSRHEPVPYWGTLSGLVSGTRWFQVWWEVIGKVPQCSFVFQDFRTVDVRGQDSEGTPSQAVYDSQGEPEWLAAPIPPGERLINCIREVVQEACGLSKEEAALYGQQSARHVYPMVSYNADEEGWARNEIGRWSQSIAKLRDLRPTTAELTWHRTQVQTLADVYGAEARPLRVMQILRRTHEVAVKAVASWGGVVDGHFPLRPVSGDSWHHLPNVVLRPGEPGYKH